MAQNILSFKKALLYSHELSYTGAPQMLLNVCKALLSNQVEVTVWSMIDGPFRIEFERAGIAIKIVSSAMLDSGIIRDEIAAFDIAYANTIVSYKFYAIAQGIIPTIWFIHEAKTFIEYIDTQPALKLLLKKASFVYCVSEYAKDYLSRYNENIVVLRNFVDDTLSETPETVPLLQDFHTEKINFFAAGSFHPMKGFDILINAFTALNDRHKARCELYLCGFMTDNEYCNAINSAIAENPHIHYLGLIEDRRQKQDVFSAMDVFVMPSRDDPAPLVTLEGAMLGKPLIISENVGSRYLVDTDNGWVVETENTEQLKNILEHIIDNNSADKEPLRRMGRCSREKYLALSSYAVFEKKLLAMFSAVYESYPPPPPPRAYAACNLEALLYRTLNEKLTEENRSLSGTIGQCRAEINRLTAQSDELRLRSEELRLQLEALAADKRRQEAERISLIKELSDIRRSRSYRLGRLMLAMPRCLREIIGRLTR